MTPPETPKDDTATNGITYAAVSVCLDNKEEAALSVLKKRSEFLAAARARKQGTKAMMIQARKRRDDEGIDPSVIRVGFTCSKKVGNAVARNRAKRRMREVARAILPTCGQAGWDYVLIGRKDETDSRNFKTLQGDLKWALRKLHAPRK